MERSSGSKEGPGWLVVRVPRGEFLRLVLPDGRHVRVRPSRAEGAYNVLAVQAPKDVTIQRSDYRTPLTPGDG